MIELSPGSFQLNATDRSPGALEKPDGAAGADAGGEDAAGVVADTSAAGPNPAAFWARTWNRYAAPEGSFWTRRVILPADGETSNPLQHHQMPSKAGRSRT